MSSKTASVSGDQRHIAFFPISHLSFKQERDPLGKFTRGQFVPSLSLAKVHGNCWRRR
jgi:hypothetical protein